MNKTLTFLRKIKKNNNTPWMHAHKDEYLEARKEFEFLVQEVITRISLWDDRYEFLEPKKCIFRFNRDTRFSNNKNPYKENFAAVFSLGGKKGPTPGYYLHVSPKEIFVGGGVWQPEADVLAKIRRYIDENGDDLQKIVTNKAFKKTYKELSPEDKLMRVPKGYASDHEFAEFLKLKSIIGTHEMSVKDAAGKGFGAQVSKALKDLKPLIDFLEQALKP